jgi:hypothetical protein
VQAALQRPGLAAVQRRLRLPALQVTPTTIVTWTPRRPSRLLECS